MTAQVPEVLHYWGQRLSMCSEPLAGYFELAGLKPRFQAPTTALWRGYAGTWEISQERLYLVGLRGTLEDGTNASPRDLLPGLWRAGFRSLVLWNHQGAARPSFRIRTWWLPVSQGLQFFGAVEAPCLPECRIAFSRQSPAACPRSRSTCSGTEGRSCSTLAPVSAPFRNNLRPQLSSRLPRRHN
jgi:hypothetical protein